MPQLELAPHYNGTSVEAVNISWQCPRFWRIRRKPLLMGPDGGFITGSDSLMDGGVTAAYWYGDLAPK